MEEILIRILALIGLAFLVFCLCRYYQKVKERKSTWGRNGDWFLKREARSYNQRIKD